MDPASNLVYINLDHQQILINVAYFKPISKCMTLGSVHYLGEGVGKIEPSRRKLHTPASSQNQN